MEPKALIYSGLWLFAGQNSPRNLLREENGMILGFSSFFDAGKAINAAFFY
jgi:hypothetical protein